MRHTAVPPALWRRSPLALTRHAAVAASVAAAAFIVALAASSAPLLRAGAESEALKAKLADLTPLGAGLTIEAPPARLRDDAARRRAVDRLAAGIPGIAAPIHTASIDAAIPNAGNFPVGVVPMARDGATAHVKHLAGNGDGAWIALRVAKLYGVHPGDELTLLTPPGAPKVHVRVGAIYLQLDQDRDNPYWVNFTVRIRVRNPDSPPLPSFMFVSHAELLRLARLAGGGEIRNTFELPIDPSAMTPARARALDRRFAEVRLHQRSLGLGCPCSVTSSLDAAVRLASLSVDALSPVIGLLAGFALAIGLACAFVAGTFGVRRRAGEAWLSVARGEPRALFGLRAAVESLLPVLAGAVLGTVAALALVRRFTPSGTVDRSVTGSAILAALLGSVAAVVAAGAGAALARGPLLLRERAWRLRLPWEIAPLASAAALALVIRHGGGLTSNAAVGAHPRLVVLALPLLVAAGVAGLAVRLARRPLRRLRPHAAAIFLATRRLAAARSLLVVLVVTAAVAVAAVTFAEILDRTLASSSAEKAYVANGADVQGLIDPYQGLPAPLPFPSARVTEDFESARIVGSPHSLELMSVQPARLARVIRWHWGGDPRAALARLQRSDAPLPAIANAGAAKATAITINGRRVPVHVVAVVRSFPGMVEGEDVLVVPSARLERLVPRAYDSATAYVWVRGPAQPVVRALERASPAPDYITTVDHFLKSADLATASRTYGYVRVVAAGAALVALLALLLFLRARAKSQLVTSALLDRMGLRAPARAAAVALEAGALVAFASAVGLACALASAGPVVTRVDPIAQYAPAPSLEVPWRLLALTYLVLVASAAATGAVASLARGDLAKAVRVA